MALVGNGSNIAPISQTFEQAVFYTSPEQAGKLGEYLNLHGFAFSQEDVQQMLVASGRFAAISALIWIVGGIMVIATFFFLLTCIEAFMEKNARPTAVLRAYGLTKRGLRRQIFWRLGAVSVYSLLHLLLVGFILSAAFLYAFNRIGLPLPSVGDVLLIIFLALATTMLGVLLVVFLSVELWWRKHQNIAQELG
jgi:hypothetical protein